MINGTRVEVSPLHQGDGYSGTSVRITNGNGLSQGLVVPVADSGLYDQVRAVYDGLCGHFGLQPESRRFNVRLRAADSGLPTVVAAEFSHEGQTFKGTASGAPLEAAVLAMVEAFEQMGESNQKYMPGYPFDDGNPHPGTRLGV